MAANGVVISRANEDTPNIGALFSGKSFLVTQRVPSRSNFLERIRANGGRIVRLETQADYIIADHLRPDCPPGSLSYTFIEDAICAGAIPDPNRHLAAFARPQPRAAPAVVRAIGSTLVQPKATRTPFTPQDDRDVYTWVQNCQRQGGSVKGYEIYKQLEARNNRHTFQSWRDRYLKRLVNNPPQGVVAAGANGAAPLPPSAAPMGGPAVYGAADGGQNDHGNQDEEEADEDDQDEPEASAGANFRMLMENIEDILNVPEEDHHVMWDQLAEQEDTSHLTAEQWKVLYEDEVLPAYNRKKQAERRTKASPAKRKAPRPSTPEPSKPIEEMTTPEMVAAMKAKAAENAQASPSVAQKRKRETATPRGNTHGRKRAKAGHSDVFANGEQEADQTGSSNARLPRPAEALTNPQNVIHLEDNVENHNQKAKDDLPTEELVQTSELNPVAKTQLVPGSNTMVDPRISNRDVDETTPKQTEKVAVSQDAQDAQPDDNISSSNRMVQDEAEAQAIEGVLPGQAIQLTEENLANQQATHGVKITRGTDLRENDENLDDYATYLRGILDSHPTERTQKAQAGANVNGNGNAVEPEHELEFDRALRPEQVASHTLPKDANGDLDLGVDWAAVDPTIQGKANQSTKQESGAAAIQSAQQARAKDDDAMMPGSGQLHINAGDDGDIHIDLTLAEPEGGFNFSSQEDKQLPDQYQWESQDQFQIDQPDAYGKTATAAEGLDTQAIYNAGAQEPDFSLPLPPDSYQDSEPDLPTDPIAATAQQPTPRAPATATSNNRQKPLSPPSQPSAPEDEDSQESQEPESITSFIARLTARGYDPAALQRALYVTSGNTDAAGMVALADRMGMPRPDIPEVWSEADDRRLGMTDAGVIKGLVERKGLEEYEGRVEFLRDWRRAG